MTRPTKSALVQLLEAVHEIEGLERIRFTSPHPEGYGNDLVEAYARLPKLVESAHLPVQSGSDRVLKLMHRGYTRSRYLEIIRKLRAAQPGVERRRDDHISDHLARLLQHAADGAGESFIVLDEQDVQLLRMHGKIWFDLERYAPGKGAAVRLLCEHGRRRQCLQAVWSARHRG